MGLSLDCRFCGCFGVAVEAVCHVDYWCIRRTGVGQNERKEGWKWWFNYFEVFFRICGNS